MSARGGVSFLSVKDLTTESTSGHFSQWPDSDIIEKRQLPLRRADLCTEILTFLLVFEAQASVLTN